MDGDNVKRTKKFEPISKKFPHMLHGGDYNPDQWRDCPEILDEDMRLMKLSGCNTMSLGIFSWTMLEPSEDNFDFSFMDMMMDKLAANGIKVFLATPSGARPAWMSYDHPEVLRCDREGRRLTHGGRHNHCYTSPYYRKKVGKINRLLAERYKDHPALIGWHISNEYSGECYCPLCREAFREWLKKKYNNDLDALNKAYWTAFWSHTYTDWRQIDPPSPLGETCTHGLTLDWKRFCSDQTYDFIKNEIEPLKEITPDIPVTTNFMGYFHYLDYYKIMDLMDVISWDNYPKWHSEIPDCVTACHTAFMHDLYRSMKGGKPFMLMESTPSCVNWSDYNKLKRPNMHILSSLQAVAHGSDTVQYFQWRKGRGASEKFHGAVVDHCGHENTRVFREVAKLGGMLAKMDDIVGTYVNSDAAILYDYQNHWALNDARGLHLSDKKYYKTIQQHYKTFWERGVNVDIIGPKFDFSSYKLIIMPMMYMMRPELIAKVKEYVENGGILVGTYVTGWVDEHDLCYLGGFPAMELKDVFGIWAEETDTLFPSDRNSVKLNDGRVYSAVDYCEVIHPSTAEVLGCYEKDFYSGTPAFTKNNFGKGCAYYIAFRNEEDFQHDFYIQLISELDLNRAWDVPTPEGVTAHAREDENTKYIFVENYTDSEYILPVSGYRDMFTNEEISEIALEPFGCKIIKKRKEW